jgi:hypothetical protein
MKPPLPGAARRPEMSIMQHPITSISRQQLGDGRVVASVSEYPEVAPPIEPQTPPRQIRAAAPLPLLPEAPAPWRSMQ